MIDQKLLLRKFPGKGGWTYAELPLIVQRKNAHFGWVKVTGTIDGIELNKYHIMPHGESKMFLPVRAEIRKKIKKSAGDYVQVILYLDNEPTNVPDELIVCLKDEPQAERFFKSLSEGEKRNYINWIYSAKREETKVQRLAETIHRLMKRLRYYDSPEQ